MAALLTGAAIYQLRDIIDLLALAAFLLTIVCERARPFQRVARQGSAQSGVWAFTVRHRCGVCADVVEHHRQSHRTSGERRRLHRTAR